MAILSIAYYPKRLCGFLSAFSHIEGHFSFSNTKVNIAIIDFYKAILMKNPNEIAEKSKKYFEVTYKPAVTIEEATEQIVTFLKNLPSIEEVQQFTQNLYKIGMTYDSWQIANICYPNYDAMFALQRYLRKEAKQFMSNYTFKIM